VSVHAREHVFGEQRFDHELFVLFVEKKPTGRDLADVKSWATNSVEIAADCEGRAAALGLKPLRLPRAPRAVPLPGTLACVASR